MPKPMHPPGTDLFTDIEAYEAWLRQQCGVVEEDLVRKHERMGRSAFDFMRCTYL